MQQRAMKVEAECDKDQVCTCFIVFKGRCQSFKVLQAFTCTQNEIIVELIPYCIRARYS